MSAREWLRRLVHAFLWEGHPDRGEDGQFQPSRRRS